MQIPFEASPDVQRKGFSESTDEAFRKLQAAATLVVCGKSSNVSENPPFLSRVKINRSSHSGLAFGQVGKLRQRPGERHSCQDAGGLAESCAWPPVARSSPAGRRMCPPRAHTGVPGGTGTAAGAGPCRGAASVRTPDRRRFARVGAGRTRRLSDWSRSGKRVVQAEESVVEATAIQLLYIM